MNEINLFKASIDMKALKCSHPKDFIVGWICCFLLHWGFFLAQLCFVREKVAFHIPAKARQSKYYY